MFQSAQTQKVFSVEKLENNDLLFVGFFLFEYLQVFRQEIPDLPEKSYKTVSTDCGGSKGSCHT